MRAGHPGSTGWPAAILTRGGARRGPSRGEAPPAEARL